jgi:hypothetical protein
MDKVSTRKQAVLDVLDEQIEELETKLAKVQPVINELNQLKKTRATLLAERSPTGSGGGGRRNAQLTMETVIHAFREHGEMSPNELAERTGVDVTIARSHLNRYRDSRYAQTDNGAWRLIGEEE